MYVSLISFRLIPAVMQSEMMRFPTHSPWMAVFFLSLLTVGHGKVDPNCKSRRCLAQMLIEKEYLSQPQNENCSNTIRVPFMEYQTLSVDTKNLRLHSRMQAELTWTDPDLAWDTSVYPFYQVMLPVTSIWTPELQVTNGIVTATKHRSKDLVVYSDGTVFHSVTMKTEVNCDVNLFNYPFAADECPVAIQTWFGHGCGAQLEFETLWMIDGNHGDWTTESVYYDKARYDRNYIMVSLSIKYLNSFITLMLPSILIVLADATSFALPLSGGERNAFKVTLVLSFTMFLIILNEKLPGDSQCSPIIRTHFCVCLILLVASMLVSLVLTRVAKEGGLIFCCCKKGSVPKNTGNKEENEDEEAKADISVIQLSATEEHGQMLRKVVNFLEDLDAKEKESERYQAFADKLDKIFFWLYFMSAIIYFSSMIYVMIKHQCSVNHFDFWYDL